MSPQLPQPTEAFHWAQLCPGPALVCRALAPHADHLFTTRAWHEGWPQVAAALNVPANRLARAHQVHGRGVVTAVDALARVTDADVVLSPDPDAAVAVQVADCVPILIADGRTGAVAAVHAGWRGLAAHTPAAAVAALVERFGSRPADLIAAIGPSIGACCYEVGADVLERFQGDGFPGDQQQRWFTTMPKVSRRNPQMPGISTAGRPGRWFFDQWAAAREQLRTAGLPEPAIFCAELCTASHPQVYCSYRRDGSPAGRQVGAIRPVRRRP